MIEPVSVHPHNRIRNGSFKGTHDLFDIKFASDLRWASYGYHFRDHVRKFECVYGVNVVK